MPVSKADRWDGLMVLAPLVWLSENQNQTEASIDRILKKLSDSNNN